jgi:hypothetical protein
MPALPDSGSFHGDFAGRKTDLVCCRRKKAVGRRKRTGVRKTFFFLDLGLVGAFVFGLGHLGRNSRSGDKFPLIKLHLSFFGRGRMVPGKTFLKWNGGWNGVPGPRGLASRVHIFFVKFQHLK